MMIHGVGIFFLSLGVRVSERLFHFFAFLCLSIYSFSFVSFHSIEYAILFLPIRLLAESQSVSQLANDVETFNGKTKAQSY